MIHTYAQINSGIVINFIVADDADEFNPDFTWVNVDGVVPYPAIGWAYDGVNFTKPGYPNDAYGNQVTFVSTGGFDYWSAADQVLKLPAGTAQNIAYLKIAILENLSMFQSAIKEFTISHYDFETRFQFFSIYNNAKINNLTNRAAYIEQIFTWTNSCIGYAANYVATVKALTNPATVASKTWDFSSLASSDPLINLLVAIGITN